jgi:DNA polymerase III alpha subunit (gram-positive type)
MSEKQMLVFDCETNGLLHDVSTIHCIAIYDSTKEKTFVFNHQGSDCGPITEALHWLTEADVIIGHNIIGYDIPVLRKTYSWFDPRGDVLDTLTLSRMYHPNLMEIDKRRAWPRMPLQLYGRHSLEAYGYRLGEYKGEFGKTTDWSEWSQEMQDYCVQDVQVTTKLCEHFRPLMTRVD